MPSKLEINSQFESLGIEIDEDILDKCEELCSKYLLSEEKLLENWIAWSFNQLNGEGPTKERLLEWENKSLSKIKINTPKQNDKIKVYSSSNLDSTPTSHAKTPETPFYNGNTNNYDKKKLIFSPACFSPDVYSPSMKYKSRANTGQSVTTFGSDSKWSSQHKITNIEIKEYESIKTSEWKYLYSTLRDISLLMVDACEFFAESVINKYELQTPVPISNNVLENSVFVGRIGAFQKSNTPILHGLFESSGQTVNLDLTDVEEYALFPGQVVALEGKISSNILIASKIFSSCMQPLPPAPTISDPIKIIVAAGPFTLCDTLSYEPLHDLIQYVKENQTNFLILIGPLIDANHPKISEGNLAESFCDYYHKIINNMVDSLKETLTKLIIISSSKEAVGIPVYPTPPFCSDVSFRNVKFYPDPSLLTVGGLVIGLTATDTILHLGKYEISNSKSNRLGRLGGHMLHQQSFYPLYPNEPDVGLDMSLWYKYARFPVTPHILIAPSDLKSFIKDTNGCVIINPERLAKGMIGGTFACIEVRPTDKDTEWNTATHISAKIVKI